MPVPPTSARTAPQPQPQPAAAPQPQPTAPPEAAKRGWMPYNPNPDRVDSLIGKLLLALFAVPLVIVFLMNLGPYQELAWNVIFGWGWLSWLLEFRWIGGILETIAKTLSVLIGGALFLGIQVGEIWPEISALFRNHLKNVPAPAWARNFGFQVRFSYLCYAGDALACAIFWPPLKVPLSQFRFTAMLQDISFLHIAVGLTTLFGGSLYLKLFKEVRRVM